MGDLKLCDLNTIDIEGIKAIFIDIDDTLYSYKEAHPIALQKCYELFDNYFKDSDTINSFSEFEKIYRLSRNNVTQRLFPGGSCRSRLLAFQEIFENLNIEPKILSYKYALEFEELYWSSLIDVIQPNLEIKNFLDYCKDSIPSLIICAISDMQTSFQIRKLNKLSYGDFLLVTSEEVGVEKPDNLIFQYALNKCNLNPEDVIMIGDSHDKDLIGASQIGIKAFLINLDD